MCAVYKLTCNVDPLTVSMVLTVRKLVSLAVSVVLFNNTFTVYHVSGAALVFLGAVAFTYESANKPAGDGAGAVSTLLSPSQAAAGPGAAASASARSLRSSSRRQEDGGTGKGGKGD